jgi:hypothetical protein
MPGRPTDQRQRYYRSLSQKHPQKAAVGMAGLEALQSAPIGIPKALYFASSSAHTDTGWGRARVPIRTSWCFGP